jgi:hypothetical protein
MMVLFVLFGILGFYIYRQHRLSQYRLRQALDGGGFNMIPLDEFEVQVREASHRVPLPQRRPVVALSPDDATEEQHLEPSSSNSSTSYGEGTTRQRRMSNAPRMISSKDD